MEPTTPEEYRREAERARMLAKLAASEHVRRQLLDVAEQYERLAIGAAERSSRGP